MSKLVVEPWSDSSGKVGWTVSWDTPDYDEDFVVNKDELLELAHLLIKKYRRACEKEKMGL